MAKLRNKPVTAQDLSDAHAEFQNESDRGCVLLGAAQVDFLLAKAIEKRLARGNEVSKTLLFETNAPIGTFASRITVAYALGIIGPKTKADLGVIRDIRNDFAHTVGSLDFSNRSVADRCKNLQLPKAFASKHGREVQAIMSKVRMMFVTAVVMISGELKIITGFHSYDEKEPFDIEK